jgi:hypothetical protein
MCRGLINYDTSSAHTKLIKLQLIHKIIENFATSLVINGAIEFIAYMTSGLEYEELFNNFVFMVQPFGISYEVMPRSLSVSEQLSTTVC